MPNSNCLEGVKCPKCGQDEEFKIVSTVTATVTDDGAEMDDGNFEWDEDSECSCSGCGHGGKLKDFQEVET